MPALRLMAIPTNDISMMGSSGPPAAVTPDNTFELRGLTGGRVLRVVGLPPGWMLRSVLVNGEDVTDKGMEFKGTESVTGVEVALTAKVTELSGTVKGPSGAPVKDYTVIVFSEDPDRWTIPNSRFVVSARPDQDGHFKVRGLPPGAYYAAAADYVAQGEGGDPELLERLKAKASRIALEGGDKKVARPEDGRPLAVSSPLGIEQCRGRFVIVVVHRSLPAGVKVCRDERHHDHGKRHPLRHLEVGPLHGHGVLHEELRADERDDDEGAVDDRRVAPDDREQLRDHDAHRDDAEEPARQHHPPLRRHRNRDQDRVDREGDVDELHLQDGAPERRETQPRPRRPAACFALRPSPLRKKCWYVR